MTMNETIQLLSVSAKAALLAAPHGGAAGAVIEGTMVNEPYRNELMHFQLIGARGGLTHRGSAVTTRLKRIQEDELFPL